MPLLHSVHVHLGYLIGEGMAAENYSRESILADLESHAHYGLGSVLSLGADPGDIAFNLREDQKAGRAGGARLFTVGGGLTSIGGWPTNIAAIAAGPQQVETEEEAREAVRAMAEKKADAIKIWVDDGGGRLPKISPELFGAAIDEASEHGLKVLAHVYYLDDAKALVEAGVSGISRPSTSRASVRRAEGRAAHPRSQTSRSWRSRSRHRRRHRARGDLRSLFADRAR